MAVRRWRIWISNDVIHQNITGRRLAVGKGTVEMILGFIYIKKKTSHLYVISNVTRTGETGERTAGSFCDLIRTYVPFPRQSPVIHRSGNPRIFNTSNVTRETFLWRQGSKYYTRAVGVRVRAATATRRAPSYVSETAQRGTFCNSRMEFDNRLTRGLRKKSYLIIINLMRIT